MTKLQFIIELLKVALSPQVVGGIIVLVFLHRFKPDIQSILARIKKAKFPGGEIDASQAFEQEKEKTSKEKPLPEITDLQLPDNREIEELKELFRQERGRAFFWEYSYLNYFLVPNTQRILNWLSTFVAGTSIENFEHTWHPLIPVFEEQQAILNALQNHNLIQNSDGIIKITPKGREYLAWRGPLPEIAS